MAEVSRMFLTFLHSLSLFAVVVVVIAWGSHTQSVIVLTQVPHFCAFWFCNMGGGATHPFFSWFYFCFCFMTTTSSAQGSLLADLKYMWYSKDHSWANHVPGKQHTRCAISPAQEFLLAQSCRVTLADNAPYMGVVLHLPGKYICLWARPSECSLHLFFLCYLNATWSFPNTLN